VDAKSLQQFARRDWSTVATSKARQWQALKRERSVAEVLELTDRMRRHAQQIRPDWPTTRDRLDDVRVHQRVGEALRAVAGRPR
jgi:uncharacterized protein YdaT